MASGFDVTIKIAGREDVSRVSVRAERSLSRLGGRGSRALRRIGAAGAAARRSLQALSRVVVSLGGLMAALGIALVFAAFIKAASDAEEVESKFRTVFRNLADEADLWATSQAKALNRSRFELREYLATLQDTFVPMGVARDEAAELSKQVTLLAVDLASFNNLAEPEVINALTSALVGNHETVRRFGVVITEASLSQELLNMGIEGGVQAASEQQKMLARLSLIVKGTSDAQGDAARTAGSFANRLKASKAIVQELSVAIGKILIPVVGELLQKFIEAGPAILKHIENLRLGLLTLGLVKPKDEVEALTLEIVGLQRELKYVSELSVGAAELGVEGFRVQAEIAAALKEKTAALTKAIESQAEAQRLAARAAKEEEARLKLMREQEKAAAIVLKTKDIIFKTQAEILKLQGRGFDAQVLLQEAAFAEMLKKVKGSHEAREQLEALHQLKLQDIMEQREAALAAFVTKELGITLEKDFLRRQRERKVERQVKLLKEAFDRSIISYDKFREAERRLRDSLDLTAAAAANQVNKAKKLAPALGDAGRATRDLADKQKDIKNAVDDATDALNRQGEAARRASVDIGEFGTFGFTTAARTGAQVRARFASRFNRLPFAQHGLVVRGPTPVIMGDAGPELALPFDRRQRAPEVQAEFERLAAAEGERTTVIPITINMDGRKVAKRVVYHKSRGAA